MIRKKSPAQVSQIDNSPLCLVQLPDALDDSAVPLMGAMAHVQPGNVHAIDCHDLQHFLGACGRPDGGHDLSAPRAPEACDRKYADRIFIHCRGKTYFQWYSTRHNELRPVF